MHGLPRSPFALACVFVIAACGPKAPPAAPAADAVPDAPAPPPPPPPAPEPEAPAEPPPPASNADFDATLTFADGRSVSGHVVRVERGSDWYAEDGWVDSTSKLTVTLESGGTQTESTWNDISEVAIAYGDRSSIDCSYDSRFSPWMYMCTLKTTTTVTAADGKSWDAVTRYKWKFTFEDGNSEEFYVFKLPVRQQDDAVVDLKSESENYELYGALQTKAVSDAKSGLTKITITP